MLKRTHFVSNGNVSAKIIGSEIIYNTYSEVEQGIYPYQRIKANWKQGANKVNQSAIKPTEVQQ